MKTELGSDRGNKDNKDRKEEAREAQATRALLSRMIAHTVSLVGERKTSQSKTKRFDVSSVFIGNAS